MRLSVLGACLAIAIALAASGTASSSERVLPRFSLDTTSAAWDLDVALRVERTPAVGRRSIRLYLVPAGDARAVRRRSDPRLSFVGTVRAAGNARLVFRVPPLDAGRYALAYWCPGCLPQGTRLGVQTSPALRVFRPGGEGCPTTRPTTSRPPGAPELSWTLYGNGALWALAGSDGITTNAAGGAKLPWIALPGMRDRLTVRYRMLGAASDVRRAETVQGTLAGYAGPSWASRMAFEPGCWQIAGRVLDVTLSFVVRVERGAG